MIIYVVFIILFELLCISNESESDCGCSNINRLEAESKKYDSMLNFIQDFNRCPLNTTLGNENKLLEETMVLIPGGFYQFGTDEVIIPSDNEGPKRIVQLDSFYMDKYEVSNLEYLRFAETSQFITQAEYYKSSFVFALHLNNTYREEMRDYRVVQAPWWYNIESSFKYPFGTVNYPETKYISELLEHPVVHVSWVDALAYCKFHGKTLPTEAQWEAACRGGHRDTLYPWGNKLFPGQKYRANIWQGTFPHHNSAKDGYIGTCPVDSFPPNDFGLYNMIGNVWEWTHDSWSSNKPNEKVKKGGSYLCHRSYCFRYRCSARSHNTKDSSAGNLGFRCVRPIV